MNPNNPQTPGIYTVEKSAFPPSVAQVPTAIPAFVGYTEKAENQGKSLVNKPVLINSLSEYNTYFGGAPEYQFPIIEVPSTGSGEHQPLLRQARTTLLFLPITTKLVLPSRTRCSTCTTACGCSI